MVAKMVFTCLFTSLRNCYVRQESDVMGSEAAKMDVFGGGVMDDLTSRPIGKMV